MLKSRFKENLTIAGIVLGIALICATLAYFATHDVNPHDGKKIITLQQVANLTDGKQQVPSGVSYENATHLIYSQNVWAYVRLPHRVYGGVCGRRHSFWLHHPDKENYNTEPPRELPIPTFEVIVSLNE